MALHFYNPVRLSSLICEEAELRNVAQNVGHQFQNSRIAVAAGADHRVDIRDGGGFRPAQNIAVLRNIAHFFHIGSTCISIAVLNAHALPFLLHPLLSGEDQLEHRAVLKTHRYMVFHAAGICSEALPGQRASVDEFLHQIEDRLPRHTARTDHCVSHLAGDLYHPLRAKGLTVHDKCIKHLPHGFALLPSLNGEQFLIQDHIHPSFHDSLL